MIRGERGRVGKVELKRGERGRVGKHVKHNTHLSNIMSNK
jgi:hypothetical protein